MWSEYGLWIYITFNLIVLVIKMKSVITTIRLEESNIKLVRKAASTLGVGIGAFIRMAIRKELVRMGYLRDEESKILGV